MKIITTNLVLGIPLILFTWISFPNNSFDDIHIKLSITKLTFPIPLIQIQTFMRQDGNLIVLEWQIRGLKLVVREFVHELVIPNDFLGLIVRIIIHQLFQGFVGPIEVLKLQLKPGENILKFSSILIGIPTEVFFESERVPNIPINPAPIFIANEALQSGCQFPIIFQIVHSIIFGSILSGDTHTYFLKQNHNIVWLLLEVFQHLIQCILFSWLIGYFQIIFAILLVEILLLVNQLRLLSVGRELDDCWICIGGLHNLSEIITQIDIVRTINNCYSLFRYLVGILDIFSLILNTVLAFWMMQKSDNSG